MSIARQAVPWWSWLPQAIVPLLLAVTILARLMIFGPRYQRTFDDFNMKLPTLSEWVIGLSRLLSTYWWIAVPAFLVLAVVYPVLVYQLGGVRRRSGWLWFVIVALLLLVFWMAIEYGLNLPMMKLLQGLEK